MSVLSRLFSGWNGGQSIVKNGKFSTTKNNHNRNRYGQPTIDGALSMKLVKQWVEAKANNVKLPSYLNPIYRPAYHQPKRAYK